MLEKNVDRWIEEWKAEGKAEGELLGIQKIAKKLLLTGMSASQVSEITGLTEEELQKLRDSVAN